MRYLTAGESHGKYLMGIIDDYPSGVNIDIDFVNRELGRRQVGYGRGNRMKIEQDKVEFISGLSQGSSTGNPISFLIPNKDFKNWNDKQEEPLLNPRPGHADLNGFIKYHQHSIRDSIERSSARETAARVCTGALAKLLLAEVGIEIFSYVDHIGGIGIQKPVKLTSGLKKQIEGSGLRFPDPVIENRIKQKIGQAAQQGDTLGGSFTVIATGVPVGLGSYTQWDFRLDAIIAKAIMSIPAIKAVEIGDGFQSKNKAGSLFHDEIFYSKTKGFYRKTNHSGGIEGGISNGQDIIVGAVMKPIPTTSKGLKTVNIKTKKAEISLKERSDVCAVPSASVIAEAMVAMVLANAVQDKWGRDNMEEVKLNYQLWQDYYRNI
ncbi:MAG: chorismate synthase [Actinomycetota bacterium]|nr:chorismate synthase [Actinomycetota bacterium]